MYTHKLNKQSSINSRRKAKRKHESESVTRVQKEEEEDEVVDENKRKQ